jgi:hypothetical protein
MIMLGTIARNADLIVTTSLLALVTHDGKTETNGSMRRFYSRRMATPLKKCLLRLKIFFRFATARNQ